MVSKPDTGEKLEMFVKKQKFTVVSNPDIVVQLEQSEMLQCWYEVEVHSGLQTCHR